MMKTAVFASLVASATAFAPSAQQSRASTSIAAKPFEKELGAMTPVSVHYYHLSMIMVYVRHYDNKKNG
jgi:hypothetical protein